MGVVADGPLLTGQVSLDRQLDLMVASGVESLRVEADWAAMQPSQGGSINFTPLDRIVGPAASRGITILPVIDRTPTWDALKPGDIGSAPRSDAPFAVFVAALARRYGPHGTFWAAHPTLQPQPIRTWQIWNEPDFTSYWSEQPFAPSYVRLLAAVRPALRRVDPQANIMLAGLPDFSWQYLAQIYRVPGARRLFDSVAIHPYTAQARGVIIILSRARAVMDRYGDRPKPILATEVSWPSSAGRATNAFGFGTTVAGQTSRLRAMMPLLAADRARLGLTGFYWYTWMGDEGAASSYPFDFSGLERYVSGRVSPKPALSAYAHGALSLEGCAAKRSSAEYCSPGG
jgi:hypothetical protein